MENAVISFNDEIFVTMVAPNYSNMEEIYNLRLVCWAWYNFLLEDEIWKHIYIKKRHTDEKLIKEKTYKQNCFIPFYICHIANTCKIDKPEIPAIAFKEIVSANQFPAEEVKDILKNILIEAFDQYPQVFCTCFGLYHGEAKIEEFIVDALNIAKERDILVVLPAGNEAMHCSAKATGIDLHIEYPNVIWVTSCTTEKKLCEFSNTGPLVDVAVEGIGDKTGTTISAFNLSKSVISLRKLRPGLTAPQIRSLIRKTSICIFEGKPLDVGLFDFDAARKAIEEFNFYNSAKSNAHPI